MPAVQFYPWQFNNHIVGAGSVAQVTVPAVPGVSHVITEIDFQLVAFDIATAFAPLVAVNDGATSIMLHGLAVQATTTSVDRDGWSWTGELVCGLGNAVTAFFAAPPNPVAGIIQNVMMQGYDI